MSCSDTWGEDQARAREAWLAQTLTADNLRLIYRAPELTHAKFIKMSGVGLSAPPPSFPFLRGALGQMYRDMSAEGRVDLQTDLVSEEGALVWLVGDPHIENLSALLRAEATSTPAAEAPLGLDWDDYDAAGYGPWLWDLRRLALSAWVTALDAQAEARAPEFVRAVVEGYIRGLEGWTRGERARPTEGEALPPLALELMRGAREDIAEANPLSRYTLITPTASARALRRGEIRPPKQSGVTRDALSDLDAPALALAQGVTEALRASRGELGALKDAARRLGQGVSSYALLRLYLLFEGPTASASDDVLWEAKELADRPVPPRLSLLADRPFPTNAARLKASYAALSWLGTPAGVELVEVGAMSFRARPLLGDAQGLSTEDVSAARVEAVRSGEEGAWALGVVALFELSGALLAGAHAYAPTLTGRRGGEVILGDLLAASASAQRAVSELLLEELLWCAEVYAAQTLSDRATLEALLSARGMNLGYRY